MTCLCGHLNVYHLPHSAPFDAQGRRRDATCVVCGCVEFSAALRLIR